jgi:hypothetical protein
VVSDDGRAGGTRRAIDSVQKQATATTFGSVGENATLHRTLKRTGRAKRAEAVADDAIERYLDILGVLSTIFLLEIRELNLNCSIDAFFNQLILDMTGKGSCPESVSNE